MATQQQQTDFINKIGPLIQAEAKKRGYLVCSPVIAQACIESAYGLSGLSVKAHNYFGLKCGKSWKGKSINMKTKEEYTVGTLTTISDNFRMYDNMEAGVRGYFDFISTTRYANLKSAKTPKEYLERIKADGYATSSTYVNTNMTVVNKQNLTRFDTDSIVQIDSKVEYYPACSPYISTMVAALASVGEVDTSLLHRKKIGAANGISNVGSESANNKMLKLLKEGKLIKV